MKKFKGTGTKQWSNTTVNFQTGCEHDCLYCYSKEMALRYGQTDRKDWEVPKIREHDLRKKINIGNQTVMFPSSHDITPANIEEAKLMLNKILSAGNEALIVSKPHFQCIKEICDEFTEYKDKILFRFTIGSYDNSVLKFWEPGAPNLDERMKALRYAFRSGYQTSVSCEPMLDNRIDKVIDAVRPYVTKTIWVGKMNSVEARLKRNNKMTKEINARATELQQWQSDDNILKLYEKYKNDPIIQWKDNIEKVLKKKNISAKEDIT